MVPAVEFQETREGPNQVIENVLSSVCLRRVQTYTIKIKTVDTNSRSLSVRGNVDCMVVIDVFEARLGLIAFYQLATQSNLGTTFIA